MNKSETTQTSLHDIIHPVLADMAAGVLNTALLETFEEQRECLEAIEQSFIELCSRAHEKELLRYFFASWSKTNNSAASVSGLANRMTLLAKRQKGPVVGPRLFDVCASLQRITDEDLGALGGKLHSDLFYTMATTACSDDAWLRKSYCLQSALDFKDWTDRQRLVERDPLQGLLTTLIHEVYTHGEVEFIHPLFQGWFRDHVGTPAEQVRYSVAWVTVHTGGTESAHFSHAVNAVEDYCSAMDTPIDLAAAKEVFRSYLLRKKTVMEDCAAVLRQDKVAA